jgi:antitoxin ParD1/3/4
MTERLERITVSLPGDLAEQARHAVDAGEAPSVSAYVAEALRARAAKQRSHEILEKIFDDVGEPGPEQYAWAKRILGVNDGEEARDQAA